MRFAWILAAICLFAQWPAAEANAQGALAERPVRGVVQQVDETTGTLVVGPLAFFVPEEVYDLEEVEEGVWAVVWFEKNGRTRIATSIEIEDTVD